MPCEHYKDALIKVAASGTAPQGELRTHVDECASCRVTLDEEQSLFAVIDSGLRSETNAEVPPSLIPRVRARLDEVVVRRFRFALPFVFASVSVALLLLMFVMVRSHRTTPASVASQGPLIVSAPVTPGKDTGPWKSSDVIAATRISHPHAARISTIPDSVASSNPEVLVPPDERQGMAQLVAMLNQHKDLAAAFLAQRPEKRDALVTVDPLQISDIEIKPLERTETETSDGTGERR